MNGSLVPEYLQRVRHCEYLCSSGDAALHKDTFNGFQQRVLSAQKAVAYRVRTSASTRGSTCEMGAVSVRVRIVKGSHGACVRLGLGTHRYRAGLRRRVVWRIRWRCSGCPVGRHSRWSRLLTDLYGWHLFGLFKGAWRRPRCRCRRRHSLACWSWPACSQSHFSFALGAL